MLVVIVIVIVIVMVVPVAVVRMATMVTAAVTDTAVAFPSGIVPGHLVPGALAAQLFAAQLLMLLHETFLPSARISLDLLTHCCIARGYALTINMRALLFTILRVQSMPMPQRKSLATLLRRFCP